jgi:hypothetical protein
VLPAGLLVDARYQRCSKTRTRTVIKGKPNVNNYDTNISLTIRFPVCQIAAQEKSFSGNGGTAQ